MSDAPLPLRFHLSTFVLARKFSLLKIFVMKRRAFTPMRTNRSHVLNRLASINGLDFPIFSSSFSKSMAFTAGFTLTSISLVQSSLMVIALSLHYGHFFFSLRSQCDPFHHNRLIARCFGSNLPVAKSAGLSLV